MTDKLFFKAVNRMKATQKLRFTIYRRVILAIDQFPEKFIALGLRPRAINFSGNWSIARITLLYIL